MKKMFSFIKENKVTLINSFVNVLPQIIELTILIIIMGYFINNSE